jgi:hypothetical protein
MMLNFIVDSFYSVTLIHNLVLPLIDGALGRLYRSPQRALARFLRVTRQDTKWWERRDFEGNLN